MTLHVAFVCTGNSCRSQIGEALLAAAARDRRLDLVAYSAGTEPATGVSPFAVAALAACGLAPRSRPKRVSDLPVPMDLAITVCDGARESCPVVPGAPARAHWGLPDPAAETTNARGVALASAVCDALAKAIEALVDLPLEALESAALADAVARLAPCIDPAGSSHGSPRD